MVTDQEIAEDLAEYLRDNPGVGACGSVTGYHWLRYHDGEFQAAYFASGRTRKSCYVHGKILDEEAAIRWLKNNPAKLNPVDEAYSLSPPTVWEAADDQDVFTDHNRCWWCGVSERDADLDRYETTDDGKILLCGGCVPSWKRQDLIVENITEATA